MQPETSVIRRQGVVFVLWVLSFGCKRATCATPNRDGQPRTQAFSTASAHRKRPCGSMGRRRAFVKPWGFFCSSCGILPEFRDSRPLQGTALYPTALFLIHRQVTLGETVQIDSIRRFAGLPLTKTTAGQMKGIWMGLRGDVPLLKGGQGKWQAGGYWKEDA